MVVREARIGEVSHKSSLAYLAAQGGVDGCRFGSNDS
jgi:hypothetical protein